MTLKYKWGLLILLFLAPILTIKAGVIVLDGTYQGSNLYVQNPYNSADKTFCITEVTINGKPVPAEDINSSAFEIAMKDYELGEYVNVQIKHKDNCKPKVLNTEVLDSKSTYEVVSFKADETVLKWTTKNESNEAPYIIEKFINNKWVPVGKVVGKGPEGFNNYTLELNHHSGVNKYRIKQKDIGGKYRYSDPIEYISNKPPVTFYPKRADRELFFSEEAEYEIYDSFGSLVDKGKAAKVNVEEFEAGIYYLNIDNRTEKFLKK